MKKLNYKAKKIQIQISKKVKYKVMLSKIYIKKFKNNKKIKNYI